MLKKLQNLNKYWESIALELDSPEIEVPDVEEDTLIVIDIDDSNEESTAGNKDTEVSKKFSIADTHSKEVSPVGREQGVKDAPLAYATSGQTNPDETESVPREEGVKSAPLNYQVVKTKMDVELPVKRNEGVKDAPKVYLESYKSSIHSSLLKIKDLYKV